MSDAKCVYYELYCRFQSQLVKLLTMFQGSVKIRVLNTNSP